MAKVDVNSASREDLVGVAGLRPEIADAVLEFRRRHGGRVADARALEELPGVGPATVDQLRRALDFGDKGRNGGDQTKAGGRATDAASPTARRVAEAGAREGLGVAHRVVGAAAETQREVVGRSAEGAAELGRMWVDLLGEQTRHNLEIATALGRAVRWDEVVQAQGEFVRAGFERLGELNRRYLEIVQGMMGATPAAVDRVGKMG